jgi:AraC family transcriptional regulator
MKPPAETIAAVGAPVFMRSVGEKSSPSAVVARFRHGGGKFDIRLSDIVQVTFNLQHGVPIRRQTGSGALHAHVAAVGSVSMTQQPCRSLHLHVGNRTIHSFSNPVSVVLELASFTMAVTSRPKPAARQRIDDLIIASPADATVPSPTLDQLASAAFLSVNHFIRAFHQQTGVTPHRHVVLRRLEHGIALLKKPGKSVAEVADDAGFATPAHFIATFRRTMGVTPGAFRAAVQG